MSLALARFSAMSNSLPKAGELQYVSMEGHNGGEGIYQSTYHNVHVAEAVNQLFEGEHRTNSYSKAIGTVLP